MNYFLSELTKIENGKYHIDQSVLKMGFGERNPLDLHYSEIDYKNQKIQTKHEIGLSNIGHTNCKLPKSPKLEEFSITTRSHLLRLFFRKNKNLSISSKNKKLQKILSDYESLKRLASLTNDYQFEFMIFSSLINNKYEITAEYNIIFEVRESAHLAFIDFFKAIIDELNY